jgi:bifunctional enzyme CysN/CysC
MDSEQMHTEDINIVIVGHVDHGKSTVIGRLLTDTNSLPVGKLEQIQEKCKRNSKPFEYAFLIDALKDEQEQGITIDSARCLFRTKRRNYIIIDAPGHIEFLKNMITGASRAEAALIVIDACEGIQENSKRHGYLLSMLGIKQLCVLVNKMDLTAYSEQVFKDIAGEYKSFLCKVGLETSFFIPISAYKGENIVHRSKNMPWYNGETVLEVLEKFAAEKLQKDKPFRMPVQGVYKFTKEGDTRRIISGTIETGVLNIGDEIIFYPSGKKSRVKSIEAFNEDAKTSVCAGYATGFTLTEQIYVRRGEIATILGQRQPAVTTRIKAKLFWLGKEPMEKEKRYLLKIGTSKVDVSIEQIIRVMDASTLISSNEERIRRNDVAECILRADKPIVFDLAEDNYSTGRFVIVDNYEISGGGIIFEALEDKQSWIRKKVELRNYKWEKGEISDEERADRYNQRSTLILITGVKNAGKKAVAKALEKRLFESGKIVYFLGIGNVLYGVDADIKMSEYDMREEHLRRLAEIAHIMLDAGVILILTAVELTYDDVQEIVTVINPEKIQVVWVGERVTTDIKIDLHLKEIASLQNAVETIKALLQEKGIIFRSQYCNINM